MAIHISCPHCQTLLQVPDNSGGQTTKCPDCADDFVIPGTSSATSATLVCAVIAPVEGTATEEDLRRVKDILDRLTTENVGLQVELARRARRSDQLATRLRWLKRFQAGRQRLDHTVGRGGGFFLTVTLGAAAAVVAFSVFPLSAFGYFFVAVIGMLVAGWAYLPFSYYPDDAKLMLTTARRGEMLVEARELHDKLACEEAAHREKLAPAEEEYRRVKAALESRLHWLRTCQWQQMTSRNFVNFLRQVFAEHGYTVEPTGKKGRVGIDLVVTQNGRRVAVAAKGSPKGPVDETVIRQTQAGKANYDCSAAIVITNAQFTPAAGRLAKQLGLPLIDGSRIPDLVEGRLSV